MLSGYWIKNSVIVQNDGQVFGLLHLFFDAVI